MIVFKLRLLLITVLLTLLFAASASAHPGELNKNGRHYDSRTEKHHSDQEDWTMLCLVTDTEAELDRLTATLLRWSHALIDPANPLYLIGTSIERMRNQKEQKRTIYDWFQEETVRILRPDAPDGE